MFLWSQPRLDISLVGNMSLYEVEAGASQVRKAVRSSSRLFRLGQPENVLPRTRDGLRPGTLLILLSKSLNSG